MGIVHIEIDTWKEIYTWIRTERSNEPQSYYVSLSNLAYLKYVRYVPGIYEKGVPQRAVRYTLLPPAVSAPILELLLIEDSAENK
jgi:hypothetical protein